MKTILSLSLAAIITVLSSCEKYEEGPKISLATKKSRIARTWTYEKSIDGATGAETVCTSSCGTIEYKKNGSIYINGTLLSGTTWQFSDDKEELEPKSRKRNC